MTPDISDFMPGSLVETDKYIKDVYGHFVIAKKKDNLKSKYVTIMAKYSLVCHIT